MFEFSELCSQVPMKLNRFAALGFHCMVIDSVCERKSFLLGSGLVFLSTGHVGREIERLGQLIVAVHPDLLVVVQADGEVSVAAGADFGIAGEREFGVGR